MAKVRHWFYGDGGMIPNNDMPTLERIAGTTRTLRGRGFDATVDQIQEFKFKAFDYDDAGDVEIILDWWADTASTNGVAFEVAGAAVTPGDADDMTTKAWGTTVSTVVVANTGTLQLRRTTLTITRTNFQTLTKDDMAWVRIARRTANAGDTLAAIAVLEYVEINYEQDAA